MIRRYRSSSTRIVDSILGILNLFSYGLPMPQKNFLTEITVGIICAQSSVLSKIARSIADLADLKAVYKRLDKNLGLYDLSRVYERAQAQMISHIDSSYLFIFDPSEVIKPFAKSMEGIALVRDGSAAPRRVKDDKTGKMKKVPVLKPGYPLRVAIAMDSTKEILPVELSLYSSASESFLSSNDENIQALENFLQRTHFQPTVVLDREFDVFAIMRHFCELRQKFIIRITKNRKFFLPDEKRSPKQKTYTREEMSEKWAYLETKQVINFTHKGRTRPTLCSFRATRVKLLSEEKKQETFRDRGDLDALILVRVQLHKVKGIPTLYLLTTNRPVTELELQNVGLSYLARWNIEEYIRFIKQHFELESFLVRDLGRMKNLIYAVYIATVILHLLTDIKSTRGLINHKYLVEQSLPVGEDKKLRNFFFYAYGRGLSRIVNLNKKLFENLNTEQKHSTKKAA